jgi:sulfoxide reductase heme-binding subunit YedZ
MSFPRTISAAQLRGLKLALFAACLVPFVVTVLAVFGVAGLGLGANPVEELIHRNGLWGLRLLLVTLAVTPLRRLTGMLWLVRLRRMLGLFAFFYLVVHFLCYAVIDQRLAIGAIIEDVIERPYITLGMVGLVLLVPLAVTSTNGMIRRLGKRWQTLHRLVYVVAVLGVWHFWWQVKQDIREPLLYAAILAVLMGYRLWHRHRSSPQSIGAPVGSPGRP